MKKLIKSKLSNYDNIDKKFLNKDYDPRIKFILFHCIRGTLGIVYNKKVLCWRRKLTSWADLWDLKYKDKIVMLDSSRDSLAAALLKNGFSMNTRNIEELELQKRFN